MPKPTDMPARFAPRRYGGAVLCTGTNSYRTQTETCVATVDAPTDRDTHDEHQR